MWRLRFSPGIETSDGRIARQMAAALARLQEASMLGRKEVQNPAGSPRPVYLIEEKWAAHNVTH
jgi:hypothetical protein